MFWIYSKYIPSVLQVYPNYTSSVLQVYSECTVLVDLCNKGYPAEGKAKL